MGHDITAIKDYNEHQRFWNREDCLKGDNSKNHQVKNDIAYLRRSMSSKTIHKFYEFLYCNDVDGGVSGRGYFVIVSLKTIEEAFLKVKNSDFDKEDKIDYMEFLRILTSYCLNNKQEGVIINFG